MRLAIDAVGNRGGGGAVVLNDVLCAVINSRAISRVTVFASAELDQTYRLPTHDRIVVLPISSARSAIGRLSWVLTGLNRMVARANVDVFLGMNGAGPHAGMSGSVVFVQQALPYNREALSRLGASGRIRMWLVRWVACRSARVAEHVIVQNRVMKEVLAREFGLPGEKISAFPPAAPIFPSPTPLPSLEALGTRAKPIGLYVGNGAPHKNLSVVGSAIGRVPFEMRPICAATLSPNHVLCAAGHAIGLGTLTRGELHTAYRAATFLIMPSLVETVGLPMLEAMRVGVPVIAADRPYAHEVCGDAALYFDPHSECDLARQITRLVQTPTLRAGMIERGHDIVRRLDTTDPYGAMVSKVIEIAQTHRRHRDSQTKPR